MPGPLKILHQFDSEQADLPNSQVVLAADGAVDITFPNYKSTWLVTKGSAAAITLAAPTTGGQNSGGHDGLVLSVISTTAFAHVITSAVRGFNGKGSSGTATFAAAKGSAVVLEAYNGDWWVRSVSGVTIA